MLDADEVAKSVAYMQGLYHWCRSQSEPVESAFNGNRVRCTGMIIKMGVAAVLTAELVAWLSSNRRAIAADECSVRILAPG